MIYTPLTEKAMKIAFEAHKGQVDKAGLPYFHHPLHLAEQFDGETPAIAEKLVTAALLHDVVEDTEWTFDGLREAGIPDDVVEAVKLLTHGKDVDYDAYITAINENDIARKVKMADLRHNLDETRLREDNSVLPYDADKIAGRRERYKRALSYLRG